MSLLFSIAEYLVVALIALGWISEALDKKRRPPKDNIGRFLARHRKRMRQAAAREVVNEDAQGKLHF